VNLRNLQRFGGRSGEKIRALRRAILLELIRQIESGEFVNTDEIIDLNKLYMLQDSVRKEYQRPLDIDWGAGMRASEIDAVYEKG
jgi:hypothetical protein